VSTTTSEAAWAAFWSGVVRHGLPTQCLSDNGLSFSGRLRGFQVTFEENLRAQGIRPITSRPFHPQTCGKVERFQQTLKKRLRARRRARTLTELQAQLDDIIDNYNHHRPHSSIGRVPPAVRFEASAAAPPPRNALTEPEARHRITIDPRGVATTGRWHIGVGVAHAGQRALIVLNGPHADVIIDGHLVRSLDLDPKRRYQPTGKTRGGPHQPRALHSDP
jgi:hypothetical protein